MLLNRSELLLLFTLKVSASMMLSYFPRDNPWPQWLYTYTCVHRDTHVCTHTWILHISALINTAANCPHHICANLVSHRLIRGSLSHLLGLINSRWNRAWRLKKREELDFKCSKMNHAHGRRGWVHSRCILCEIIGAHSALSVPANVLRSDWQDK